MKNILSGFIITATLILAGCAGSPQKNVALSSDFYSIKDKVVGVYFEEIPNPDTHLIGAGCLLCYAAASVANSSLTSHIETLNTDELDILDEHIVQLITDKGIEVNHITSPIDFERLKSFSSNEENFAKDDFRSLKESLGVDELIVIDLDMVGAYRSYNNYIPTSDPLAAIVGKVYTVDLHTNKYTSYGKIDEKVSAQGDWDEPPSFPGITNAYYQAIEATKDTVIAFFKD